MIICVISGDAIQIVAYISPRLVVRFVRTANPHGHAFVQHVLDNLMRRRFGAGGAIWAARFSRGFSRLGIRWNFLYKITSPQEYPEAFFIHVNPPSLLQALRRAENTLGSAGLPWRTCSSTIACTTRLGKSAISPVRCFFFTLNFSIFLTFLIFADNGLPVNQSAACRCMALSMASR